MRKTKLVTFKVTRAMREEIDDIVRRGLLRTRSELVREAVLAFLEDEYWKGPRPAEE